MQSGLGMACAASKTRYLVEYLASNSIPLEICPTSNICLKVYPDYAHHPLRKLWDAGLLLTIGSDDPPMFGTDLNHEYQVLVNEFQFHPI